MQEKELLPSDFDGVFRFTNFSDEDFSTLWNSVEYTYPAKSTTIMLIQGESMENIQEIRKVFAKRLALREFYKSKRYDELNNLTGKSGVPPLINEEVELATSIQKCLEPLAESKPIAKKVKVDPALVSEHTRVVDEKASLKANSTDATGELESLPVGE